MYGIPSAKPNYLSGQIGFAACAFKVSAASTEVQLFPAGRFKARDGRPNEVDSWYIDAGIARRLIADAALRTTPYLIDYEHQTLLSKDNGKPAPRSAKFTQLEWREGDGLYAIDVEWTAQAKAFIENDEYEFISPVFPYNKTTGAVMGFFHAALTNDPAIDGMEGVAKLAAARFNFNPEPTEKNIMNKALLKLLGLNEDANEEDVQQAVAALTTKLAAMNAALVIADDDDGVAAIAALKSAVSTKPDPAKFVPVDVVKDLQTQVAALTTQINTARVDDLVELGLSNGKLLPAQEEWARDLGESDVAALTAYLESAQPIAALKGNQSDSKKLDADDVTLSDEAIAVCKQMGISEEDYKKSLAV
ncbi:MAG: phage protease [Gammaproteobacteria bacterium]|nr:phage protease [Gammaproteobacteria bacterium]